MTLVVDASVVAAWVFNEHNAPNARAVLDSIGDIETHVPQLFAVEIANALLMAERRERISSRYADDQLALIAKLPLTVDAETSQAVWAVTHTLARMERLTVYDATYLELALRLGADLATFDADLIAAARRRGLGVLP